MKFFTLCLNLHFEIMAATNYIGGHAKALQHGAAIDINTKYSEILFANSSVKKCSYASKITSELLF